MGNRVFLYTVDGMPGGANAPSIRDGIAEANNFLPPLWMVLFSAAAHGPAQDAQQVFLPSVCGGVYAERGQAEQRLARLLDFVATHPLLAAPDDFAERSRQLMAALSTATGTAYYAELNEYFWLGGAPSPEAMMDRFVRECAARWEQAEAAMGRDDHARVADIYGFTPQDAAAELGFDCWTIGTGRWTSEADDERMCEGLYRFEEEGRFGLRRADGTVALPARYDDIAPMDSGAQVGDLFLGAHIGLYDTRGELVVPPMLDELYDWSDGVALARLGGKYGYLDKAGRWLVEPRYDDAYDFAHGLAMVCQDGLAGYIDATGREAIARRFLPDSSGFNEAGVASVATSGGYGLIDARGRALVDACYASIDYIDGLEAWRLTHRPARIDLRHADGTPWISGSFDEITYFEERGDAVVRFGDLLGTYRRSGQPGLPVAWRELSLLCRQDDGAAPGFAIYLVGSGHDDRDGATGAYLDDGTQLVPPRFAGVDVLQQLLEPPGGYDTGVPELFVVDAPDGAGQGLWSAREQRLVLPCDYTSIHAFVAGGQSLLLLYHPRWQWIIADRDGRRRFPHGYTGFARHHREPDLMAAVSAAGDIARAWNEGEAAHARRAGQGWRLCADGTEATEEAWLLARVRRPGTVPIAASADDAARLGPHVIAGVGDPQACEALGDVYALGDGVAVDLREACRWYATAAAGDWHAKYTYARCLAEGRGCERDPDGARRQLEAVLELVPDWRDAANLLGSLYERELGEECDPARARQLYTIAAGTDRYGSDDAQYNLGRCWRDGIGGPADPGKALKWFELAAIATPGTPRNGHAQACGAAASLHGELARKAQARRNDKAVQRHLARAEYFARALQQLAAADPQR